MTKKTIGPSRSIVFAHHKVARQPCILFSLNQFQNDSFEHPQCKLSHKVESVCSAWQEHAFAIFNAVLVQFVEARPAAVTSRRQHNLSYKGYGLSQMRKRTMQLDTVSASTIMHH